MNLFFLRHADAEASAESDFERKLTPKGIEQARRVGAFCQRHDMMPEVILCSPLRRACETAEIVADRLGNVEVIHGRWLACGMTPQACADELKTQARFSSVMLVGHEPDFSAAVSFFLGCRGGAAVKVRKASLTLLAVDHFREGGACLEFSIPARLM